MRLCVKSISFQYLDTHTYYIALITSLKILKLNNNLKYLLKNDKYISYHCLCSCLKCISMLINKKQILDPFNDTI